MTNRVYTPPPVSTDPPRTPPGHVAVSGRHAATLARAVLAAGPAPLNYTAAEALSALVWGAAAANPWDSELAALTEVVSPPGVGEVIDTVADYHRRVVELAAQVSTCSPAAHANLNALANRALDAIDTAGGIAVDLGRRFRGLPEPVSLALMRQCIAWYDIVAAAAAALAEPPYRATPAVTVAATTAACSRLAAAGQAFVAALDEAMQRLESETGR